MYRGIYGHIIFWTLGVRMTPIYIIIEYLYVYVYMGISEGSLDS